MGWHRIPEVISPPRSPSLTNSPKWGLRAVRSRGLLSAASGGEAALKNSQSAAVYVYRGLGAGSDRYHAGPEQRGGGGLCKQPRATSSLLLWRVEKQVKAESSYGAILQVVGRGF